MTGLELPGDVAVRASMEACRRAWVKLQPQLELPVLSQGGDAVGAAADASALTEGRESLHDGGVRPSTSPVPVRDGGGASAACRAFPLTSPERAPNSSQLQPPPRCVGGGKEVT